MLPREHTITGQAGVEWRRDRHAHNTHIYIRWVLQTKTPHNDSCCTVMCSWGPLAVNVQARFLHGAAPSGSEATHRLKDKGWGEGKKKKTRKKVDLHGSSWLREQEDNRKRALAQAADGLNRKVNGKCKEHTNRGFRQTRGVYLKHTHNVFTRRKMFSSANLKHGF